MKNGKQTYKVTALLVAVLAIMAFIRGPIQVWLLAGAFVLWALWVIVPMMVTARKRARHRQKQQASQAAQKRREFEVPDLSTQAEGVLLRHVNFRISAYLKSAYPDVTWEWEEKEPERIITKGGTARIKLFGVPDFNYANVIFDCKANINCDMMRIIPLSEVASAPDGTPVPPRTPPQPSDPQIWYEMQARQVLEDLIADLHSRGHNSLTIKENGDICIKQADAEVSAQTLKNFPARNYWQALAKVFEKEGLAAAVTDTGLAVTW